VLHDEHGRHNLEGILMMCEEIVNSVLRRYLIAEPTAEDPGQEIKRPQELLDRARQSHISSTGNAEEETG